MEAQIAMVKGVKNLSKYTLEVRNICESLVARSERAKFMDVNEVIKLARPNIFNFDYPKWDSEYNEMLEEKILRTYYMREIGVETYGLFKLRLQVKLNDIMPYYNKLYESEKLKFDPLKEIDLSTVYTKEGNSSYEKLVERILNEVIAKNGVVVKTDSRDLTEGGGETHTENKTNGRVEDLSKHTADDKYLTSESITDEDVVGQSDSNTNQDGNDWSLFSDTPQGTTSNINLGSNDYLTNVTRKIGESETLDNTTFSNSKNQNIEGNVSEHNTGNVLQNNSVDETEEKTGNKEFNKTENLTGNSNESITDESNKDRTDNKKEDGSRNSIEEFTQTMTGKNSVKSYSALVKEYRHTFLNIDRMVIEEMGDLFMNLW